MTGQRPPSLVWALRLLAVIVGFGLVLVVLIVVLRDDLIRTWAEGRPDTRRALQSEGLQAVKDGAVRPPAFVPVALVMFVVVALLIWVLAAFLRGRYPWARVALTATMIMLAIGTVAGLRTGAPTVIVVLSVASLPLEATTSYLLWRKDASAHLRS